jgi:nitroreductase
MDALEAILTRRSIRSFTDEPIDDETITKLLEAAMAAPSACNQQPWSFVVIRDRTKLDAIPKFQLFSRMLKEAPCAIVICGKPKSRLISHVTDKCSRYWEQDCAAATQNILLAAHAEGLGAVWLGAHPSEKVVEGLRSLLGVPEDVMPFAIIALGHPGEQKPPADRFDQSRVHYDQW